MTEGSRAYAVVTGASSGIGRELAKVLAREGYGLLLVARRTELLESLAETLRREHGAAVANAVARRMVADLPDEVVTVGREPVR